MKVLYLTSLLLSRGGGEKRRGYLLMYLAEDVCNTGGTEDIALLTCDGIL